MFDALLGDFGGVSIHTRRVLRTKVTVLGLEFHEITEMPSHWVSKV